MSNKKRRTRSLSLPRDIYIFTLGIVPADNVVEFRKGPRPRAKQLLLYTSWY